MDGNTIGFECDPISFFNRTNLGSDIPHCFVKRLSIHDRFEFGIVGPEYQIFIDQSQSCLCEG